MLICLYLPDSLIFPPSPDPSSSRRRKEKSNTFILFSLIRYVTETIRSVSVLFSDSEDEPADPNIIYEEPDDEASSSDKDVSDAARTTFSIVIFLADSVRRDKREMLSISQKRIPPPPCSHGPLPEE